jgi:hypothetical protein
LEQHRVIDCRKEASVSAVSGSGMLFLISLQRQSLKDSSKERE